MFRMIIELFYDTYGTADSNAVFWNTPVNNRMRTDNTSITY